MYKDKGPKVLVFDIETAPNLAHVWRFFKENIHGDMLQKDGHIMSFAAKWLGNPRVIYAENRKGGCDKDLVKKLIKLIDEADVVIGHNAKKFDMGWVRSKAAIHRLKPPSPVKVIDTYIESKKHFWFESYRLAFLAEKFGVKPKSKHANFPGHTLWSECLKGNAKAWQEMRAYNIQDVETTEDLYFAIRPWITNHPNAGIYIEDSEPRCPKCGSVHVQKRGFAVTNLSKFQRYQCVDCGGWGRGRTNLFDRDNRKELITNVI